MAYDLAAKIEENRRHVEERYAKLEAQERRRRMKAKAYDNMINHSRNKQQHDMYEMIWRSL